MTLTASQLDEIEEAVSECLRRGLPTVHCSAASPAAVLQLVAIARAALAWSEASDELLFATYPIGECDQAIAKRDAAGERLRSLVRGAP